MADYQQLIDDIRNFLAAADQTENSELANWATEYVNYCRSANQRLRQCSEYLKKGLRTEAIHLADTHPPILDLVSALDFPEVPAWLDVCLMYSLPGAPQIATAAAQALSDAYNEQVPLQKLLNVHRTFNLAQAPLADRMEVLRQLAQADPTGPNWEEDLRLLERNRSQELVGIANRAVRNRDRALLSSVLDEFNTPNWRTPLPAQTRKALEKELTSLRIVEAEKIVTGLLPKLREAHSAMNVAECQEIIGQIDAVTINQKFPLPEAMVEDVSVVRGWLSDQAIRQNQDDAFEESCAKLQQGLDRDAQTPELERLYRATVAFPIPIPDELENRYQQRLRDRVSTSKRRMTLITSGIAAVVILILASIGIWFYSTSYQNSLQKWVIVAQDATSDLKQTGNIERATSARKSIVEQGSRYSAQAEMVAAISGLDDAIAKENIRAKDFQSKLHAAAVSPIDKPDTASLDAARALVKTNDEHAALQEVDDRINDYTAKAMRESEQSFQTQATALRGRIENELTDKVLKNDKTRFLRTLSTLDAQLTEMEGSKKVSVEFRNSVVQAIRVLLDQRQDMILKADAEAALVENVRAVAKNN